MNHHSQPSPDASTRRNRFDRTVVHVAVFAGGSGGLIWELLWQHHTGHALGVSAAGTALTLACIMGGMAIGSIGMERLLVGRTVTCPLRVYGTMELFVGLWGTLLAPGFEWLSRVDTTTYQGSPGLCAWLQSIGILLLLGPAAVAMGAGLPLFRQMATRHGMSLALLYGTNTAGAVAGVVAATWFPLPDLGVVVTGGAASAIGPGIALLAWLSDRPLRADGGSPHDSGEAIGPPDTPAPPVPGDGEAGPIEPGRDGFLAVVTGFSTFALETAWFRSLRAAFQSTTDSFAVMLLAVLIPLAVSAPLGRYLSRRRSAAMGVVLSLAGLSTLLATPLIERLDTVRLAAPDRSGLVLLWMLGSLALMGPTVLLTGMILPCLLERHRDGGLVGWIYGANTLGSMAGALVSAWILLPWLGFAGTAWLVGLLLAASAGRLLGGRQLWLPAACATLGLVVAVGAQSGAGRLRAQSYHLRGPHTLLAHHEGPDATISVVLLPNDTRQMVIDGFMTCEESMQNAHYMAWMGRLPMIVHPGPARALVICFGTGQTANGVREERPEHLDVVDLNRAVYEMAPLFPSNRNVLADPRVTATVMDGRAWLRRTRSRYDVVTLEPMAPYFAGVNGFYSREFYRLVKDRLNPGGVVAQWLPFHLVSPEDAASVARTFLSELPGALLWVDPVDRTGILVGTREPAPPGPLAWPGLKRASTGRNLTPEQITGAVALEAAGLGLYAEYGAVITDDNQLLAYGQGRSLHFKYGGMSGSRRLSLELIKTIASGHPRR
ncbi:MAG: fused MFS/spermidine synthase [Candidatus Riflebacteria bacterium]|nr:fused MFS/spermidine synthase [Candidatus Riflebacteria bacterium]